MADVYINGRTKEDVEKILETFRSNGYSPVIVEEKNGIGRLIRIDMEDKLDDT